MDSGSPQQKLQDLNVLLKHLDHKLSKPSTERDLQRSSVERSKIGFSIEYARNLLLRLGHEQLEPDQRGNNASSQSKLQEQKKTLKSLEDRLFEIDQDRRDESPNSEDEDSVDSDTEEFINRYAPAVQNVQSGLDVEMKEPPLQDTSQQTTLRAASALESTLRSRRAGQTAKDDIGSTSGRAGGTSGLQTSTTTPFQPKATQPTRSDQETLMAHHSSEQEDLSGALLSLASALKQSTVSFSDSLTASNPLVDQTAGALDKSSGGMEAAQKRMGLLRRMTEGKGKLGRIILYAWVAGLWVVLILIMFVMPKLRF